MAGTRAQSRVNLTNIAASKARGGLGPVKPDPAVATPKTPDTTARDLQGGRAMRVRKETEEAFGVRRGGR